ncbi:MAG TPA: hypothetical protein VFC84_20645 [Desulfosporosinus sp.]|nr:hypothetical protein [Desulfosporosinus sp.]
MKKSRIRLLKKRRFFRKKLNKKIRRHKRKKYLDRRLIEKKTKSERFLLFNFLNMNKFAKKPKKFGRDIFFNMPRSFSFIENPDETIQLLRYLFYCGIRSSVEKLNFNYVDCEKLGICASTVMDVVILEIKKQKQRWRNRRPFNISAQVQDESKQIKDILEVSGLIKHLGFPTQERSYITKLDLLTGSNNNKRGSKSGEVATQVTDYFIRCINTQGLGMGREGIRIMGDMIGEIIGNCETHGGTFTQWYTLGHYSTEEKGKYGECHLVFFNFGSTIYESLNSDTTSIEIRESLANLTRKHRGFFKMSWTEESLWTLYALQDGVSRLRDREKDPDRGTGTVKLIDCFQSIGETHDGNFPAMSITSGRTHIYFDGKYKLADQKIGNEYRQVIAFNSTNDLNEPPDPNNVRTLKNFFPGTVISMRFYLDRTFITRLMEESKNGNKS